MTDRPTTEDPQMRARIEQRYADLMQQISTDLRTRYRSEALDSSSLRRREQIMIEEIGYYIEHLLIEVEGLRPRPMRWLDACGACWTLFRNEDPITIQDGLLIHERCADRHARRVQ